MVALAGAITASREARAQVELGTWPRAVRGPITADYEEDVAGRVPLRVVAGRTAQTVVVERRAAPGSSMLRGRPRVVLGAARCVTPCALHVPPGEFVVRAQGPGTRATDARVTVPREGALLRLRESSSTLFNLGVGLTGAGASVFVATAVVALVRQGETREGELLPGISPEAAAGLGALAVGLLGAGIPLMVLNRGGVAEQRAVIVAWGTGGAVRLRF